MVTSLSSKSRLVLPARVRRRLRLAKGERLSIKLRGRSVVLRPMVHPRRYRTARHPKSGLPVRVAVSPPERKVTAAQIARLNAELL